jgi:hypothetical protein
LPAISWRAQRKAPALVRTVLLDDAVNFEKGEVVRRALSPALGDSIPIADGARSSRRCSYFSPEDDS